MSQLLKALGVRERKSFGFGSIQSSPLGIRTNVLSSGLGGSNNSGVIKLPSRNLTNYLRTMDELKSFEQFSLVQNILKLLTDYINNQLDLQTKNYIEIPDDTKLEDKVNSLIRETRYNEKFIKDIPEIIYYGGKGYKTVTTKIGDKSKLELIDLIEPYKIVLTFDRTGKYERPYSTFLNERVERKYNVFQNNNTAEVDYSEILFIGYQNFKLVDANSKYERNLNGTFQGSAQLLTDDYSLYASKPLMYSVIDDIKDYLVKKVLSNLLSIKDVLIPTFMRLGVDLTKATDTNKINSTVNELESKINESIDTSILMGEVLDIDMLVNMVFSTVRVLPDPGNLLSTIDQLNLDPLKEKLESINNSLETTENNIMDQLGIPSDLFDGGSNQYEVVTRNQRYQSTLGAILAMLRLVYKNNVIKLYIRKYPSATRDEIKKIENAVYRIFRLSSIELEKDKNIIEQNQELTSSIQTLTSAFLEMMQSNPLIDNEKAMDLLRTTLGNLGTNYGGLLVDKLPDLTPPEF